VPGGNWPVQREQVDPRATVQKDEDCCGCACALIVFELLGLWPLPSQDELFETGGAMLFSVATLSSTMDWFWRGASRSGKWVGGFILPPDGVTYADAIPWLARPWIAHLREPMAKIGHFVVVVNQKGSALEILDPVEPGTSYTMDFESFMKYWNYESVYLRAEP
jgi:hypothetical protein